MQKLFNCTLLLLFCCILNGQAVAEPWFTGPILAPAGHTVPYGHTNFELYFLDIQSDGIFNGGGRITRKPLFTSYVLNPILTHGFADWLDVQLVTPYTFNNTQTINSNRLGDVTTSVGLQLIQQKETKWRPDVRILISETFPTGAFELLNPALNGTDSSGLGSYQTQVGLNLQLLSQIFKTHYLRTRFIISHLYTSPVRVRGLNTYGGTPKTYGRIASGYQNSVDLAFEYTMTQHWVAVMEGYATVGSETRFDGDVEIGEIGGPSKSIGAPSFNQVGLTPAIEYNFNSHIGVIGGVWLTVSGKNTAHFTTYVLALNAYW